MEPHQSSPASLGVDPVQVELVEPVPGSDHPVHLLCVETWDGLYAPIGLRIPDGPGAFPLVVLASGNWGRGHGLDRDAVRNRGYIMEELLNAGHACAWLRYRTEIELGYNQGFFSEWGLRLARRLAGSARSRLPRS